MHSLCSAYHWSYADAMHLTIPQIMMLNHAAHVEYENGQLRYEYNKKVKECEESGIPDDPYIDEFNRPLTEMSDAQMSNYLSDWSKFA